MRAYQRVFFIPLVSALSACGGGGGGGEDPAPTSSSQALEMNTTKEYVDTVNRSQLYKIPVVSGESYSFEITNDDSSINTLAATILDGNQVAISDRTTVTKRRTRSLDFTSNYTGTAYLKIERISEGVLRYGLGAFDADLVHDDASFEPNGSRVVAYPVQFGATYLSQLSPTDQADWFVLDVVEGDAVNITVNNMTGRMAYVLRLRDANGDILKPNTLLVNGVSNFVETVHYTGKLFLEVVATGEVPSTVLQYSFSFSM